MNYKPTDGDINYFAKANFRNKERVFGIRRDDRRRHMYVVGKTGVGKTTLLENMAINDIKNGEGIAYFDPHGDSVEKILDYIPSHRINDVVYFDPHDAEYPIGFNVLEVKKESQKNLVASGMMAVFTKLWANVWSARMEYILNNTVLALLDTPGQTLLGIPRMYSDKKYRNKVITNIKDPVVKNFWEAEFANYNERYRTEAVAPIQNKVGQFLSSSIIRNIVSQPKSTIDFRDIMDNGKILLVNLSKGKIGEDSSALLGGMMITKLQLAAMSRVDMPESGRRDFYLYVDEFQNFATESFANILSEARKYRLNLVIAHQYIAQLFDTQTHTSPVRDAVFGNIGTLVSFRVGAEDAEFLEREFLPVFEENDLVNLPKYHVYLKLMINGVASTPFSATTLPPISESTNNRDKIIRVSRERYAAKSEIVEKKLAKWLNIDFFTDVGKSADIEEEEQERYDHYSNQQNSNNKNGGSKNNRKNKKPTKDKVTSNKKEQDSESKKSRPQKNHDAENNHKKPENEKDNIGEKAWKEAVEIQSQKTSNSADKMLDQLMGVLDDTKLKPSTIKNDDTKNKVKNKDSKSTNKQRDGGARNTSVKDDKNSSDDEKNQHTSHEKTEPSTIERAKEFDKNNPRKLKAGERVKFE